MQIVFRSGLAVLLIWSIGCAEESTEPLADTTADTTNVGAISWELPEGDPDLGREAFLQHGCNDCHEVALDSSLSPPIQFPDAMIGPTLAISSRDDAIRAILSGVHFPQAPQGEQPESATWPPDMGALSTRMTVAELINIAAYLASPSAASANGEHPEEDSGTEHDE